MIGIVVSFVVGYLVSKYFGASIEAAARVVLDKIMDSRKDHD